MNIEYTLWQSNVAMEDPRTGNGKSIPEEDLMGNLSKNGGCSITIFDYQRLVGPTWVLHYYKSDQKSVLKQYRLQLP